MFSFKSVAHFFASVVHDAKVGVQFLADHQTSIDKAVETGAVIIDTLDPALAPLVTAIERAAESALGEVFAVVNKLDAAAAAKGADVHLDTAAIEEFKALLASIEKLKPGITTVPAGLASK